MKVWIDQDLCTGDGLCEEIAPKVFKLLDDGLAYVVEGDKVFNPGGPTGLANFDDDQLDGVVEAAEECPGECIYIEPWFLDFSTLGNLVSTSLPFALFRKLIIYNFLINK